jgi:PAS domain S-box-containing protein
MTSELLPRETDELIALYEIGKAINSTLEISEVLNIIMTLTTKYFGADAGSIMLLNKEELSVAVAYGLNIDNIKDMKVKLGESISGKVALTGEPLLLIGPADNKQFKKIIKRKEDIKSSLCVPLKVKGEIRGVLNLRKPSDKNDFTSQELKFLSMIADQSAIAIENARLYELEKQRAKELQHLNQSINFERLKLEAILKNLADGVMVLNEDDEIVLINFMVEKIFNVKIASCNGKNCLYLINEPSFSELIKSNLKDNEFKSIQLSLSPDRTFEIIITRINNFSGEVFKVIIFHDITNMKKIHELKSDLVSMVSHELRTPLTSIIGFADILLNKDLEKNRKKKYLSIIQEEALKLLDLINNLLDLSKLESGHYVFKDEKIDLVGLFKKAIDLIIAQSAKHIIICNTPDEVFSRGDEDMIYRVITNLLSNAIKYSPAGGNIIITINEKESQLEISLEDNGIGIPKEDIPHLFEKFYRTNLSINKSIKGSGLGLANVKYILEAHGGSIFVESELHKGSKFTFYLPKEGKMNENQPGRTNR